MTDARNDVETIRELRAWLVQGRQIISTHREVERVDRFVATLDRLAARSPVSERPNGTSDTNDVETIREQLWRIQATSRRLARWLGDYGFGVIKDALFEIRMSLDRLAARVEQADSREAHLVGALRNITNTDDAEHARQLARAALAEVPPAGSRTDTETSDP